MWSVLYCHMFECERFYVAMMPKGYKYKKEVHGMSKKCEICGKGQVSGNNVSHSMRHTRRKWNANIQKVRVVDENGTVRRANVCTRCLRSGLVNRAL